MTRRYPDLPRKQLERDSKIAMKIVQAYDIEKDLEKVLDLWRKYHSLLSNPRYWELLKTVWIAAGHTTVAAVPSVSISGRVSPFVPISTGSVAVVPAGMAVRRSRKKLPT